LNNQQVVESKKRELAVTLELKHEQALVTLTCQADLQSTLKQSAETYKMQRQVEIMKGTKQTAMEFY